MCLGINNAIVPHRHSIILVKLCWKVESCSADDYISFGIIYTTLKEISSLHENLTFCTIANTEN